MKRCSGRIVSGLFLAGAIFTAHGMESSFQNLTIQTFGQLYPRLKQDVRGMEKRLIRLEKQQKITNKSQQGMLRDIRVLYFHNRLVAVDIREVQRRLTASMDRVERKIERLEWDILRKITSVQAQLAELCLAQNLSGQQGADADSSSLFELSSTTFSSEDGPGEGHFIPEESSSSNVTSGSYEELL